MMQRIVVFIGICSVFVLALFPAAVSGLAYGQGSYGSCQYSSCSITLTSNSTVAINVAPTGSSPTCTVAKDDVTVTTGSSTGYTALLSDVDTANQLTGSNGTISAVSGTASSPALLSATTWGYRVDGQAGFGNGPTNTTSNGSIPSLAFSAVPKSNATPATIASTSIAATNGVTTPVWYGVCVNTSTASGTYSDQVTYTAVTN